MKIIKKVSIVIMAFVLFVSILNLDAFADNFNLNAFDNDVTSAQGMQNLVNDTASTAISVVRVVCVTIAIVILLVIAMKYMISAPGDRADIKKHAVHYVIGAFVLFAVTGILSILDNFAKQI